MNHSFCFDIVLPLEEICNHLDAREEIWNIIDSGQRLVLFGRRNTGKTSIVKSDLMDRFAHKHEKGLVVFVDLMDTASEIDFCLRLQRAFAAAIAKSSASRSFVNKISGLMKQLRLTINVDHVTGLPSVDLGIANEQGTIPLEKTLELIAEIHRDHKALLIFDEFQDVSLIRTLPAKIRSALQAMPIDLPVLVLGSKKQLLSKMFADQRAPFASWGRHFELPAINEVDYHAYINSKFQYFGLSMTLDLTRYLLGEMQHIPEAINIVCDKITKMASQNIAIDMPLIIQAIATTVEERSSLFRERLHRYTEKEIYFLRQIALDQPVEKPLAKSFVSATRLSVGGLQAMVNRLENEAMIYRLDKGYVINDPLLQRFLAKNI